MMMTKMEGWDKQATRWAKVTISVKRYLLQSLFCGVCRSSDMAGRWRVGQVMLAGLLVCFLLVVICREGTEHGIFSQRFYVGGVDDSGRYHRYSSGCGVTILQGLCGAHCRSCLPRGGYSVCQGVFCRAGRWANAAGCRNRSLYFHYYGNRFGYIRYRCSTVAG